MMTTPSDPKPGAIPAVAEAFASVAGRFCSAMETPPRSARENFRELQLLLAELNLAALSLPDSDGAEGAPDFAAQHDAIARGRLTLLPSPTIYWDIFDPLQDPAGSPVANSLQDDLGDIYHDVKLGLLFWQAGYRQEACWQWRFLFQMHWGEHLVGAMRAFYFLLREDLSLAEEAG